MAGYMAVHIIRAYFDAEAVTKRPFVISVDFRKVFLFVWLDMGAKEIAAAAAKH